MTSVRVALRTGDPLTPFQRRLWASQRLAPGSPLQNMALVSRLDGPVDAERLVAAFARTVEQVEALRTRLDTDGSQPLAVVEPAVAITEIVPLPADEVAAWAARRVAVPLDMTVRPYDSVVLPHPDGTASWYLCIHHVVTDATSSARIFELTAAHYHGEQPADPPSYRTWVREALATGDPRREASAAWWRDRPDTPPLRRLYRPAARPTPASRRHAVPLDGLASAVEQALAGPYRLLTADLSWTALLLTVTAAHVSRVAQSDHVTIGVPVHNRRSALAREVVGLVMEVFPVAIDVRADDTFATLHRRVARTLADVLRHAGPGLAPATEVDAVVNVIPRAGLGDFGTIPATTEWVHAGASDPGHLVRVQLTAYESATPAIALDVNDAVADDRHHGVVAEHWSAFLAAALHTPTAEVASVDPLTGPERAAIDRWSRGPRSGPAALVVDRLAAALRDRSDTAVSDGARRWSGRELWDWIEAFAADLTARGAARGTRIGVCLPRSAEAVVALVAVLRTGASYVVLDPAHPERRRATLAERAGCAFVIDGVPTRDTLGEPLGDRVVAGDDEAYVLFTSGSTGEPKGVPILHRGLAEYLDFAVDAYTDPASPPVAPLFGALTFDLTVTTLFVPLLSGGRVEVIASDGAAGITEIARRPHLTWMKATPSHLELLVRQVPDGHALRTLVVGGEAFSTTLAQRLTDCFPGVAIFNEYGPTEAVVGCMIHRFDPPTDATEPSVPIGRPAPGVHLEVMDESGRRVPLGAEGELWIASPGLTPGYLGRSPDEPGSPFRWIDGERFYRSGDLVALIDEERLTYRGRIDSQLKVGGVRIEPAEIEAALERHPGVGRAVVALWSPARRARAEVRHCARCGLPSDVPGTVFDDAGVCGTCREFDRVAAQTRAYFRTVDDLVALRDRARAQRSGRFDAVHLLSGGKDSTYSLYCLVELGFEVLAVTLDNGYISDGAKENIRRTVADLGIEHRFATTEHMAEIFRDSLARYSNVCNGCYKVVYTVGVQAALEVGAPLLVTGLSRGQLFETRLMPSQFGEGRFDPDAIDRAVLSARKHYHRTNDATNRLLAGDLFADDEPFERVEFVDFYRYVDVELAEMLHFLTTRAPWVRPADTGRSTNCLINAAGIHTHRSEQGYHNYAIPYAWDVRLGHKTREEAMDELDDELDLDEVGRMLGEVGYVITPRTILTAWVEPAAGHELPAVDELRRHLATELPAAWIPAAIVAVPELPQTPNGKLDTERLPGPGRVHRSATLAVEVAETPTEVLLVRLAEAILRVEPVSVVDDVFELGADSLAAIELAVAASDALGRHVPEDLPFRHPRLRELAAAIDELPTSDTAGEPAPEAPPVDGPPVLTAGERALLFEARSDPTSPAYLVARWYRCEDPLDPEAVRAALHAVAAAHEPLHWTFGEPRRQLRPDQAVELTVVAEPLTEAAALARAEAVQRRPLDLDRGPLVRAELCRLAEGGSGLAIVVHHVSADAAALDTLWTQFTHHLAGSPAAAPPSFSRHVAALAARAASEEPFWHDLWSRPAADPLGAVAPADDPAGYLELVSARTVAELRRGPSPSIFGTALTAILAALRHYGTDDRFAVGVTTSLRDSAASDMVGYFLNVLPVPFEVRRSTTVTELGADVGRTVAGVLAHRHVPASRLLGDGRRGGPTVTAPSVIVAFFDDHAPSGSGGVRAEHRILWNGRAVTDVTVFVRLRGDQVVLGIEHRGTRLPAEVARRLLGDIESALHHVLDRRHTPIGEIPLPGVAAGTLDGPTPIAPPVPLPELVRAAAARRPDAVAVECGTVATTYAELVETADGIAAELLAAGARPGDRVLVHAARRADSIAAFVGCWFAGAAYVPVDPTTPTTRQELVRAASGAGFEWRDGEVRRIADGSAGTPGDAYVLFTSGSTGTPRGVAVRHESLATSTAARIDTYGPEAERFLVISSLAFDSSVAGLGGTLATGGTVVLPTDTEAGDVDALVRLMGDRQVTATLMVPTLYAAALARGSGADHWPATVVVAGEACPAELVSAHARRRPSSRLVNEYGPTEATVWATVHWCEPGDPVVPIGRPIPGTSVRVEAPDGAPLPAGCRGELVVRGPGVTEGYLDDPEATARKFGVDPDGVRTYRTGDLAHVAGGVVWFDGRTDDQLNVGGVRVEPREIEAVLERSGTVGACVVVAADPRPLDAALSGLPPERIRAVLAGAVDAADPLAALREALRRADPGRDVLVAHVEAHPGGTVDVAAVRRAAAALPPKLRPRHVVVWDRLPRSVHGKLDRAATARRPVTGELAPAGADEVAASSDSVDRVAAVFALFLGHAIGPDDDFFLHGGDSLGALGVVTELERRLGRPVTVTELIEAPTARALARRLQGAAGGDGEHPLVEWFRRGRPGLPVTVLFAYAGGGHLFGYRHLVEHLLRTTEGPVVGLRLPGADDRTEPQWTIEAQIDAQWEPLTRLVDGRPFVLFGGSSGGLLAWEAARRLADIGRADLEVVLMDTVHPDALRRSRGSRLQKYRSLLTEGGVRAAATEIRRRVDGRLEFRAARKSFLAPSGATGSAADRELVVRRSADEAALAYVPGKLAAPVRFVAASESDPAVTYHRWRELVSQIDVTVVEGTHVGERSIGNPPGVASVAEVVARAVALLAR